MSSCILAALTSAHQLLRWATVWPQQTWCDKWGGCCAPFRGGAGSPSNKVWSLPWSNSVPSGMLTHPTVWPQTDRQQDRLRSGSIGRAGVQTVAQLDAICICCFKVDFFNKLKVQWLHFSCEIGTFITFYVQCCWHSLYQKYQYRYSCLQYSTNRSFFITMHLDLQKKVVVYYWLLI